jgi:hypothetical protein
MYPQVKALEKFLQTYQPDSIRADYLGELQVSVNCKARTVTVTNGKLTKTYTYEELG